MLRYFLSAALLLSPFSLFAQSVEVDDGGGNPAAEAPSESGKGKANEYFKSRQKKKSHEDAQDEHDDRSEDAKARPRYLALHIGSFFTDQSYRWGSSDLKNVGRLNAGVTYRLGEWVHSMDFAIRIEYTDYQLDDGAAKKISFSPLLTFPDANSRFPLYFGAGIGPGLFIQQVHGTSPISLDWQVVGGLRFLDVFGHLGFMLEAGLKNHVFLLSNGQFNGIFINVGTVFVF